MPQPEHNATRCVAAIAAMAHHERKRPLAFGNAFTIKSRPLIEACCQEQKPSENLARVCHPEIEQTVALEHPLHDGRDQRESDPYKEIADSEPDSCCEWPALCPGLSADTGVRQ